MNCFPNATQLVGQSLPMRTVAEYIRKIAPHEAAVLILGESGTGKELVARTLHRYSSRREHPFVAVNCAALPENLIESELFGHEKGAFTGAVHNRPGKFEQADHGTLFLDEIGDMPLAAQAKLLRVIEERAFQRLGSNDTVHVDIRIVAATNRDLETGVCKGWFRKDLYYRLNVLDIHLPPLRERKEDIPELIDHFVAKWCRKNRTGNITVSLGAYAALQTYPFPGNVRELENVIQRAIILSEGNPITEAALSIGRRPGTGRPQDRPAGFDPDRDALFKAMKRIHASNGSSIKRPWHQRLKCVRLEQIHQFLVQTGSKEFTRKEFAKFLKTCNDSDTNRYKTAGVYLGILKKNSICIHNGKKANRSRYRLSEAFGAENKNC